MWLLKLPGDRWVRETRRLKLSRAPADPAILELLEDRV